MSWVDRDELASIVEFSLLHDNLSGPVNAASPNPARNIDFARTAARVLGCRPRLPLPGFLVRLMFGEMGKELMLASRRIQPAKLLAAGYRFQFPELQEALRHEIGQDDSLPETKVEPRPYGIRQ